MGVAGQFIFGVQFDTGEYVIDYPKATSHDIFKFWELTGNISEMV